MNFTILTLEPKAFKMVAKENSVSSVELSYDWFKDEQFIFWILKNYAQNLPVTHLLIDNVCSCVFFLIHVSFH